ncbi:glycosyltransferase involved in cell wall biosynthesis [Breznakibacter xylanolyticus]|uniref:Glycosyltransferase involved in cell wall biosynthesis n=1 Tax=Breznakibacter xylanolyticus TaxID=990 RepID=A0A2W7P151_9BACT|nr:glycosyltransferase family 2 protein [Breznakibacter xylanolyticus]PZX19166.1 glycosyltransferase involved in cell wall biosynthesis [Breznakibacter xylanolyticus]
MEKNLVSILIPVYNRANIVSDSIESALNQTYKNIEIIIVDNCSTDETWNILTQYALLDGRIQIFRNEKNIGPVRNWISCVEKAKGEFSKILWSDDIMHESFIEKALPFLKNHDVGFVYSQASIFSGINQTSATDILFRSFPNSGTYNSLIFINGIYSTATFEGKFPYSPGCALFRTDSIRKNLILNFPNKYHVDFSKEAIGNDLMLFLLTASDYPKFGYINECLNYFRAHAGSISTNSSSKLELIYLLSKAIFFDKTAIDLDQSSIRNFNSYLMYAFCGGTNILGEKSLKSFYKSNTYKLNTSLYLKLKCKKFINYLQFTNNS